MFKCALVLSLLVCGLAHAAAPSNSTAVPGGAPPAPVGSNVPLFIDSHDGCVYRAENGVWNTVICPSTLDNPETNSVRFAAGFSGADMCAKINAALADLPSTGGTVDARGFEGSQACASNPFTGSTKRVVVILGAVTVQMTAQWALWNHSRILGAGQDLTHFQAVAGFPTTGVAMIRLGATGDVTMDTGIRVENLWLDCNGVTLCTGIQSTVCGDGCGGSQLTIEKYKGRGISMEGLSDRFLFNDISMGVATSQTTTTSLYVDPAAGKDGVFRRVNIKSLNATQQSVPGVSIGSGAHLYDIVVNDTADGVLFNTSATGSAHNVTGGTNIGNVVRNVSSGAIALTLITKGAATNTVKDDSQSPVTTLTDAVVASYASNAEAGAVTLLAGNNEGFQMRASTTSPGYLTFQRVAAGGSLTTYPFKIDANGSIYATKLSISTGPDNTRYSALAANSLTLASDVNDCVPSANVDITDCVLSGTGLFYFKGNAGAELPFVRTASQDAYGLLGLTSKTFTIAAGPNQLPSPGSVNDSWILAVNDANVGGSCTSSGGTHVALCRSNGSAWVPVGDGSGGSSFADSGFVSGSHSANRFIKFTGSGDNVGEVHSMDETTADGIHATAAKTEVNGAEMKLKSGTLGGGFYVKAGDVTETYPLDGGSVELYGGDSFAGDGKAGGDIVLGGGTGEDRDGFVSFKDPNSGHFARMGLAGLTDDYLYNWPDREGTVALLDDIVGPSVSDAAYDATDWNGVTDFAPSKNAIRDYLEANLPSSASTDSFLLFDGGWHASTVVGDLSMSAGTFTLAGSAGFWHGFVFWGSTTATNAAFDTGHEVCAAHNKNCDTTFDVMGTPIDCATAHIVYNGWLAECE